MRIMRIKLDKEKHEVILKCRNKEEMKLVLEYIKKGGEQIIKEARESVAREIELSKYEGKKKCQ